MTSKQKITLKAWDTDLDYAMAIRKQFGETKNRFDVDPADYNDETKAAHEAFLIALEKERRDD